MAASRKQQLVWVLSAVTIFLTGLSILASNVGHSAGQESTPSGEKQTTEGDRKGPMIKSRQSKSGYDITPLSREAVADLASKLDPKAYEVTQRAGTEPPFCGGLLENKKEGVYTCVVCGLPLFSSGHKFESGTGWPSFYAPFDADHVTQNADASHGMTRAEITCARCNGHLGHVFDDGPPPTGSRYCLNSASLKFYEKGEPMPSQNRSAQAEEIAYFAGGCFWGLEHYFQLGPGVIDAVSGYMQGKADNPTYKQVCGDTTGHAETVKVVFDSKRITYRRLLQAFFAMHDPTQLDRQGPDVGTQYRSGIWYANDQQRKEAEAFIKELSADRYRGRKIVTQVDPAKTFWPAEEYHQDYLEKTGGACHVSNPW